MSGLITAITGVVFENKIKVKLKKASDFALNI